MEDRDYKYTDIKKAIEVSAKKDRTTLINNIEQKRELEKDSGKTEKTEIFDIPFLVTYSHPAQKIKQVLKQRKSLLDVSFTATKVRPRLTFRRQRNLSDIIIQKGLRGPITKDKEKVFTLCGEQPKYRTICPCKGKHNQKICRCCAHAKQEVEGIKVKLYKRVDCDTTNIIYMIGCRVCSKKYVGETQQKLKERLVQHLGNISKLKQPIYIHFNQVHTAENLYITILETVKSEEAAFRKVREAWWINRLQTLEPRGFNVKLECSQTYTANQSTIRIERSLGQDRRR